MGHGRLRWWLVASTVLVASIGLPAAPASAAPTSTPEFESPAAGPVAGDVNVVVKSTADSVQFFLDGNAYGPQVTVAGEHATAEWPTWSRPNGGYTWTAADCDLVGCNVTGLPSRTFTVANAGPTITEPANNPTVSGDVTVTATSAAPSVQFSFDGVAGSPVVVSGGSASTVWPTSALADGVHTVTAAACDVNGCNTMQSSAIATTVNTGPTVTPIDGATVSGVVNINAATLASQVQFSLDGNAVGGPVAVSGGSAPLTWTTWGLANGSHTWTAAAVCENSGCTRPQSTVNVTLDNAAPAITSPSNGDTASATPAINATAPGGGLAFVIDGTQAGFDATAPYSFEPSTPLSVGSHTVLVRECDTTGTTCNGPSSPTITFTVGQLSPSITSVAPNPFSPGTASTKGRTSFRVSLPDAQRLAFSVENGNGQTVEGPHSPAGLVSAGNHMYTWDGRNNAGKVVPDGLYTIVVDTSTGSGTTLLQGSDRATVRVDHSRSSFAGVTGAKSTFYPVADGFLDRFQPTVRVNEGGRLWMVITTPHGTRLRVISQPHSTQGTFRLTWNGRNSKNQLVPAGNYGYRFLAEDRAGNRSESRRYLVKVSHRRTTRKTIAIIRPGDVGRVGATNARCTQYSFGFSNFAHGLWLDNFCDRGFEDAVIYADYTLAVPGAVRYEGIRIRTVGATYSPGPISVQLYNFTDSKWDAAGKTTLRAKSKVLTSTFRRVSGAHHVSLRHRVRVRVVVPNFRRQEDYDIARAGIVLTYQVLR